MKTNALKSSSPLRVLPAILLLLTMSLWSCELFDKHKHPEPAPEPEMNIPKKPDQPPPIPPADSIPVPPVDSIPVPTPPVDSIPVPDPTPQPGPLPQPQPDPKPNPNPGPVSKVPANLVGKWNAGHFSWGEFWTPDGSYSGNAVEVGIAFDF
ncbi:MAG TPA: hypothetical protein VF646_08125, partial [Cytophagales bacterium]